MHTQRHRIKAIQNKILANFFLRLRFFISTRNKCRASLEERLLILYDLVLSHFLCAI
ncbi:hypothetical protein SAMN02745202_00071 [Segatella oulorum]|uniref:Uncharacterized protein n=2 Tax=Segatella oulorum TaxID=28136 RepID=G1WCI7_9BACT|nr:hypothetical protein HMPREF9431_01538 [Segatella oulorum F0390]SJZ42253.1 hypothetical protein SAMN02745202_00071 [Segatella oulorum]